MRRKAQLLAVLLAAAPVAATWAQEAPINRGHNPGDAWESVVFGLQVGVVGLLAVFAGLLAVYAFMVFLRRALERGRKATAAAAVASGRPAPVEVSAEVAHAIALALFMDLRVLDDEAAEEVTIKKLTQPFSPWKDAAKTELLVRSSAPLRK